jgi:hypothetical protein
VARDIVVRLLCDLCGDGTEASQTVQFATGSRALYEFEVCPKHYDEFQATIQGWRAVARAAEAPGRARATSSFGSSPARSTADRERLQAVREWARGNGFPDLGDRGRIPGQVQAAYDAAHPDGRS